MVDQETLQEIQVDLAEVVVSTTLEDHTQDHQEFVDKVMQVEQVMLLHQVHKVQVLVVAEDQVVLVGMPQLLPQLQLQVLVVQEQILVLVFQVLQIVEFMQVVVEVVLILLVEVVQFQLAVVELAVNLQMEQVQ